MSPDTAQQEWEIYRERELAAVTTLLKTLGFKPDLQQPHVGGERYLMRAITTTSGRKLILLGRRERDGQRVVIKVTSDPDGMRELEHERKCRRMLAEINFAYHIFRSPEELLFTRCNGYLISIQQFIDQERTFLSRPLKEQFTLALTAFKAQESAHATTYGHERLIRNSFGTTDAARYLTAFVEFRTNILRELPNETVVRSLLDEASKQLREGRDVVEQYCGFLTHTDFVPHNIRIHNEKIYLLDHSSLRFGNKYEGWARFVNFMVLYNPPLASALIDYVRLNRTTEELLSLKLMRVYRLGEIIWYYTNTLKKCSGNLCSLNKERIHFWAHVLAAVLHDEEISLEILNEYRHKRDTLRSEDEKLRQENLH